MLKTKIHHQQKRYLQIGFSVVFIVSFAVIVAERSRLSQEPKQEPQPLPLAEYVAGDAIGPGPGIQDYRGTVMASLVRINQVIAALVAGEAVVPVARQAYESLLGAPVPPIYRSLHTVLVALAKEASRGGQADLAFLREKQAQLYRQYPWLP